jgi:4a-hydroxytetrahydrobiopterin dehydratase
MSESRKKLTDSELREALAGLPGWGLVDGKLHREFRFADFVEAWGFMSRAALVIQARDHHPEWSNVYGTVTVDFVTHSAGGITPMDVALAGELSKLAG